MGQGITQSTSQEQICLVLVTGGEVLYPSKVENYNNLSLLRNVGRVRTSGNVID